MIRTDFILDTDGDFPLDDFISGGIYLDTPINESDPQHILDNIMAHPGQFKQYPPVGFGASRYKNSEYSLNGVSRSLNIALDKDQYASQNGVISPKKGAGFDINTNLIYRK